MVKKGDRGQKKMVHPFVCRASWPVVDKAPDKRENRSTGKLACLPAQKKMPKLKNCFSPQRRKVRRENLKSKEFRI
jgi:hypothetical protein